VSSLPAEAATAVALFAATNVDDLVVLALLTAAVRAGGRPRRWQIWSGQYLGFAALVGVSLAAGRGLSLLPAHWLWLLALIPLALGLILLATALKPTRTSGDPSDASPSAAPNEPVEASAPGTAGEPGEASASGAADLPSAAVLPGVAGLTKVTGFTGVTGLSAVAGVAGVATLTVVDGADNLAAYTPVFATADVGRITVTLVVFAVGVAVWCAAGALLTRHHRITDSLQRYGRWILPVAFILIGLYTLHTTHAPIRP
jgi:cadmium resistance protein CadD (predicted permease)